MILSLIKAARCATKNTEFCTMGMVEPDATREPAARGSILAEPPPYAAAATSSGNATDHVVLDCGSFEAARRLVERGCVRVAVLDFASDSEPGGGWRGNQQGTQEESLCRASSLGRALERLPYPIPTYGMAVVPEVLVLRDERGGLLAQPFVVGAIAAALRECGGDGAHIRKKAEGVCACAAALGYDGLVLGSWGCGAFGNDVGEVCGAFAQALRGPRFAGAFAAVAFADPRRWKKLRAKQTSPTPTCLRSPATFKASKARKRHV